MQSQTQKKWITCGLLASCLIAYSARGAATPPCKGNPKLVGRCFTVHGRAEYGNGTPNLRIWIVGTKRKLGVTAGSVADDAEAPVLPSSLHIETGEQVFADFEVCPFTPYKSQAMQMVCIESAKKLIRRSPSDITR